MMDELSKRYENMTYEEAKSILREKMDNLKMSFIAAGYYLKYIRDHEQFREDGYESIWEFAEDNYGIKKSTASRWMAMNDKFSQGGNSPILAKEYRGFEKSQLQEMLYLDDKQIETVTPDMTVKEIREVRKPEEPKKEEWELKKPDETDREYLKAAARYLIESKHKWFLQDYMNRVMLVDRSPDELKKEFGKSNRWCHFSTEKGVASINLFDDYVQIWNEENKCIGDFDWFHLAAAIQSMWNIVAIENAQKSQAEVVATSQQAENEPVVDMNPPEEESDPEPEVITEENIEVVNVGEEGLTEELYEETSDQSDIDLLKEELEKAKNTLDLMLSCYSTYDIRVRKQKLLIGALSGMICDLDINDIPEADQPELPNFRNNDQRKEWLRDYKSWGLWYEDKNIGARYYKYDFDNGARLIAEVYEHEEMDFRWKPELETCYLHLIGGPEPSRNGAIPKWTRHEKYCKHPSNETELVEFLKYVQKEGK